LPHDLIEAFKATLEEVTRADLLLHVVDVSSPLAEMQFRSVLEVLDALGSKDKPTLTVLNKIDLLKPSEGAHESLKVRWPEAVAVSALQGTGFEELSRRVVGYFAEGWVRIELKLSFAAARLKHRLYEEGKVLSQKSEEGHEVLVANVPWPLVGILEKELDRMGDQDTELLISQAQEPGLCA